MGSKVSVNEDRMVQDPKLVNNNIESNTLDQSVQNANGVSKQSRFTAKEIAQLFREIDLDNDGKISREEVARNLETLRIPT